MIQTLDMISPAMMANGRKTSDPSIFGIFSFFVFIARENRMTMGRGISEQRINNNKRLDLILLILSLLCGLVVSLPPLVHYHLPFHWQMLISYLIPGYILLILIDKTIFHGSFFSTKFVRFHIHPYRSLIYSTFYVISQFGCLAQSSKPHILLTYKRYMQWEENDEFSPVANERRLMQHLIKGLNTFSK